MLWLGSQLRFARNPKGWLTSDGLSWNKGNQCNISSFPPIIYGWIIQACVLYFFSICVFVAYLSIYLALTSLNNTVTWCRPPMSTEYFGHSSSVWHWQWKNSSHSPHHFHNNVEYSPVWNSGGRIPRQSEEEVMTQVAVSPRQHGRAKSNTAMRLFSGDGKKYVFQPLGERKTGHKHNAFSSREVVI